MLKQIMVPVAAFAITVTGASAFSGNGWLKNLDLTDAQVSALEQVKEIHTSAHDKAEQVLTDAGIDKEKMREIHGAMREGRMEHHEAVETAIENNDYNAFVTAIADTPLADKITSQADFEKMIEAHTLKESGDRVGAQTIFKELGLEGMNGNHGGSHKGGGWGMGSFSDDI